MSAEGLPIVLLVDDDPHVLSALGRSLRRSSVALETARNAREALERLERTPVDLVLSDQKMPGMQGIELLKAIRKRWPRTKRILMSGWTSEIDPEDLEAAGLEAMLAKPWDDSDLREAVRGALDLG